MENDAPEGACYICGPVNPVLLEEHHIIPRRYGGPDGDDNLVALCPKCHDAIERIYDDQFFDALGVEGEQSATQEEEEAYTVQCEWRTCTASADHRLTNRHIEFHVCEGHRNCQIDHCHKVGDPVPVEDGKDGEWVLILCSEHRVCHHDDCFGRETSAYESSQKGRVVACDRHADELLAPDLEEDVPDPDDIDKEQLEEEIRRIQESHEDKAGAPVDRVYDAYRVEGVDEEEIEQAIQELREEAVIYSPDGEHVRLV